MKIIIPTLSDTNQLYLFRSTGEREKTMPRTWNPIIVLHKTRKKNVDKYTSNVNAVN